MILFAAYLLNPKFQYSRKRKNDSEVLKGITRVVQKFQPNVDLQIETDKEV